MAAMTIPDNRGPFDELPVSPPPADAPPVAEPAPVKRRRWLLPVVVSVAVLAVAAAGTTAWLVSRPADPPPAPKTLTVYGALVLPGSGVFHAEGSMGCSGRGGYSDIREGVQVVVTDEQQAVVGVGTLRSGLWDEQDFACRFRFEVPGVPSGRKFYGISVGRRGTVQYTEDRFDRAVELQLS